VAVINEWTLYGTADTAQPLTIAQPVTLSYGAQTASLTGISGDKFVPQDFSSSGLNIPAYVVSNTATVANTVAFSSFGPFAGEGSLYFPGGTGAYVNFGQPTQLAYNWTSYDFTLETWVYPVNYSISNQNIFARDTEQVLYYGTDGVVRFYMAGVTTPTSGVFTGGTVTRNQWNHLSVSWSQSAQTIYMGLNGTVTAVALTAGTPTYTGTRNFGIGQWSGVLGYLSVYVANLRIVRGAALYTTSFTPPTGPLQPIQGVTQAGTPYGTVLLLRNAPAPGRVLTSKFGGANSGGVLAFPPAAMTGYSTALNSGYGQGTYVASASTEYTPGAYYAWYAFDKSSATQWGGSYSYTANVPYGGTVRTVDVNGTSYAGEWLQIQKPSSIVLSSYSILPQSGPSNTLSAWYVLGSRDGTNWFLIDQRSGATWTSGAYNTYQVQASQAFSYFRIVINIVSNGTGIGLPEWTLNGTIEGLALTQDGRLGVGVSNPVQALEVAGSAVVAGTLSAGNPLMFRNALYNGDMRIAQRGTTGLGFNSYTLDRWYISSYGAGGSVSVSQIQSGLANFSNALQLQSTSTSSANFWLSQSLETRDVVRFQGQAVTVSFWYRIPTSFTQGWVAYLVWSTAVDTKLIDNGVTNTGAGSLALPNTTAWTYASFQAFVPPTAQSLALQLNSVGGNTVNGAQFQLTGVQLEKGSVATPFEVRPYATELALCQRYCETSFPQGTTPAQQLSSYFWGTAMSGGSGGLYIPIQFQVRKRVAPTSVSLYRPSTLGSGTWGFVYPGTGWVATPTPTTTTTENGMLLETTGGTSTAGNAYLTGGHWLVSSEL
jgi:hypothetical protein